VLRQRLSRRGRQNLSARGSYRAQGRSPAGNVTASTPQRLLRAERSATDCEHLADAAASLSEAGVLAERPSAPDGPATFQAGQLLLSRFEVRCRHAERACGLRNARNG